MINKKSRISVVILNYNGEKLLKKFLPSVIKYTDKTLSDIYVIDNDSQDGSIELLKDKFPDVKIIINSKNYGFAKGYNLGTLNITSDYIVFLNNDVEVTSNWLTPMLNLMDNNKDIGTCQPKILSFNERNKFEYAGASGGYLDYLGYPFCRGRIFDFIENDENQYDDKIEIFWSSGACFMMRNELFKKNNGFDESFFAHMEEIDLCWRIQSEGYKNYCVPKSKVYHLGGGTLGYNSPTKTYLNFRNNLLMILKNESLVSLIIKLPLRMIFDIVASFSFLIMKKSAFHFYAIYKAYFSFILRAPKILLNKKNYNRKNSMRINLIIPINYYLKGKKRFSDL